jgi:hypothetical protein
MEKIDIEYDDTIASDYEEYQKAACLGYVNPQAKPIGNYSENNMNSWKQ